MYVENGLIRLISTEKEKRNLETTNISQDVKIVIRELLKNIERNIRIRLSRLRESTI